MRSLDLVKDVLKRAAICRLDPWQGTGSGADWLLGRDQERHGLRGATLPTS